MALRQAAAEVGVALSATRIARARLRPTVAVAVAANVTVLAARPAGAEDLAKVGLHTHTHTHTHTHMKRRGDAEGRRGAGVSLLGLICQGQAREDGIYMRMASRSLSRRQGTPWVGLGSVLGSRTLEMQRQSGFEVSHGPSCEHPVPYCSLWALIFRRRCRAVSPAPWRPRASALPPPAPPLTWLAVRLAAAADVAAGADATPATAASPVPPARPTQLSPAVTP
jgi:hypothetical protein